MPIEHRKVIDQIQGVKNKTVDIRNKAGSLEPSEEEILGLRFKPGDQVILKETGEVVKVARGKRASYVVQAPGEKRTEGLRPGA
jgi:hypothetical protein